MGTEQLKELKRLQKEDERLRQAVSDLFILRGIPVYIVSDNVLCAEYLADLASGHCRVEASQHVQSMA